MPAFPLVRPLPLFVVLSLLAAGSVAAADTPTANFSGIWRLDELHSDSAADITKRLQAERKREQPPVVQPAAASSSASPLTGLGGHSGRGGGGGGGRGMGGGNGGGGGRHGGRGQNWNSSSDSGSTPADPPPPLLQNDGILNVQQDAKTLQVSFNNTERLDARLDGGTRQTLNGSAVAQSQLTPSTLQISLQFDSGVRLEQAWTKSADGHHLTVTERWITPAVQQPIEFKRSYDRLDL